MDMSTIGVGLMVCVIAVLFIVAFGFWLSSRMIKRRERRQKRAKAKPLTLREQIRAELASEEMRELIRAEIQAELSMEKLREQIRAEVAAELAAAEQANSVGSKN